MVSLVRCKSDNRDFMDLVQKLDADLDKRNGLVQLSYDKYNKVQHLETVVVAYINHILAGCGCFKR